MFNKLIPNKEVEIKIYSLQYSTGSLFIYSEGNDNIGVHSKNKNMVISSVQMFPAYTYEEAVKMLRDMLLDTHDLFIKEIKIIDYSCVKLNTMFDWAFELHGEKDFEEDEVKEKEVKEETT